MYPLTDDNLPHLRTWLAVVAVAEEGSMAAAARRLHTHQQTVSARVHQAEVIAGRALFTRTPEGSALTEAGAHIVAAARPFLDAAGAFAHELQAFRGEDFPTQLAVAASNTVAELYFPHWAASFRAQMPAVRVSLSALNSDAVQTAVLRGEVELGVIEGADVKPGLTDVALGTDHLVVVAPPTHPWAMRTPSPSVTRDELRATPLILREVGSGTRSIVEQELGVLAQSAGDYGSIAAQRSAALALGLPTVIASHAVDAEVARGSLVQIGVSDAARYPIPRLIRAVYLTGEWRRMSPPARRFLELAASAGLPGEGLPGEGLSGAR